MPMNALAFGEILWDIIEEKPYLGGAPLNLVAHLAQESRLEYLEICQYTRKGLLLVLKYL